jgi:bifunctional UDP-N-acetylglucosamine pyrophosphorylase/glucosamine-1-phosphate N-acetyltransferase
MIYRWWKELKNQQNNEAELYFYLNNKAARVNVVENSEGIFCTGKDTFISEDARLKGNIIIGANCMIGTGVIIRGHVTIQDDVRIGYGVEIKDSIIKSNTTIGPLCYLGDSLVERNVYLGAMVRTSNHRLDRSAVKSWNGEGYEDTSFEKLGVWIKEYSSLGIGVAILPGRIVPESSVFSPHIVITKNYPVGVYRLVQNIIKID